jgi:hypothetical protein
MNPPLRAWPSEGYLHDSKRVYRETLNKFSPGAEQPLKQLRAQGFTILVALIIFLT